MDHLGIQEEELIDADMAAIKAEVIDETPAPPPTTAPTQAAATIATLRARIHPLGFPV